MYRLLWEKLKQSPNIIEKYDQKKKTWEETDLNFFRDFVTDNEHGLEADTLEEEGQSTASDSEEKETIPVYRCNLSKIGVNLVIYHQTRCSSKSRSKRYLRSVL